MRRRRLPPWTCAGFRTVCLGSCAYDVRCTTTPPCRSRYLLRRRLRRPVSQGLVLFPARCYPWCLSLVFTLAPDPPYPCGETHRCAPSDWRRVTALRCAQTRGCRDRLEVLLGCPGSEPHPSRPRPESCPGDRRGTTRTRDPGGDRSQRCRCRGREDRSIETEGGDTSRRCRRRIGGHVPHKTVSSTAQVHESEGPPTGPMKRHRHTPHALRCPPLLPNST